MGNINSTSMRENHTQLKRKASRMEYESLSTDKEFAGNWADIEEARDEI
jgi:hypothetical protein